MSIIQYILLFVDFPLLLHRYLIASISNIPIASNLKVLIFLYYAYTGINKNAVPNLEKIVYTINLLPTNSMIQIQIHTAVLKLAMARSAELNSPVTTSAPIFFIKKLLNCH